MWDKVLSAFQKTLNIAETSYLTKAKSECIPHGNILMSSETGFPQGFDCTEEENTKALASLRKRAWLNFRSKVDEQTADTVILGKLRTHFEERFRYDEQGIPRVWKPEDDIDNAFRKAKEDVRTNDVQNTGLSNM